MTELLELVGLTGSERRFPAQLSGGQQQRVALARALAAAPGLLLLDEPLSALDAIVRVHLRDELRKLQRQLGVTTYMVTHDQEEALSIADRIVVMNHPRILVGRTELSCPHSGVARQQASVCLRPEDIAVLSSDWIDDNTFDALVESIDFLGSYCLHRVSCPALARRRQTAMLSARAVPCRPQGSPGLVTAMTAYCTLVSLLMLYALGLLEAAVGDSFLNSLDHTLTLLTLCGVPHFYTTGDLTEVTALKALGAEFESVSASLKGPLYKTFWRVTLTLCTPAMIDIALYFFINAMTKISAVVFLYSPDTKLASVAILNLDESGEIGAAAAMAVLIAGTSALAVGLFTLASWRVDRRTQAWKNPH